MKQKLQLLPLFALWACFLFAQTDNVGIGTTTPNPSAALDIQANDKGLLLPRMTALQRQNISNPAEGLMVYDTDSIAFYFFDGDRWLYLADSAATKILQDVDEDTKVEVEQNPDEDFIRFSLGGTERWVMTGSRLESMNSGGSIFIGKEAGSSDDGSDNRNVAVGYRTLNSNTTGNYNTANGSFVLSFNTNGSNNTANGSFALYSNTTGNQNTANGYGALNSNTVGYLNSATGFGSLASNSTGSNNTANGPLALNYNTTGQDNTANGSSALPSNTTGSKNTASGYNALLSNITGSNNTALGYAADVTTDSLNKATAIGFNAKVGCSNCLVLGGTAQDAVNVGIGTATPSSALEVNGAVTAASFAGDGSALTGINVNDADADPANELLASANLNGSTLEITDAGGITTVDLSSLTVDGTTVADGNTVGLSLAGSEISAEVILDPDTSNILSGSPNGLKATETDPKVGANAANYLPKWDGSALVQSSSVFEDGNGNVGIRTTSPDGDLEVFSVVSGPTVIDQQQTAPTGSSAGLSHWQSITAGISGFLERVDLYVSSPIMNTPSPGTIEIYEGEGPGGTLLATESVTFQPVFTFQEFALASPPYLNAGSPYTILFSVPNWNTIWAVFSSNNPYPGGMSSLGDSYDHLFKTHIAPYYLSSTLAINNGKAGIGRIPATNKLEVEGEASKTTAGNWLANSDARLKKNIRPINCQDMLRRFLALRGVTYEWNDSITGTRRPIGIQYGFTAQNIQEAFPTLVKEDALGYLQTAYGTYDAMTVEAIRALHEQVQELKAENKKQRAEIERLQSRFSGLEELRAAGQKQKAETDELNQRLARLEALLDADKTADKMAKK